MAPKMLNWQSVVTLLPRLLHLKLSVHLCLCPNCTKAVNMVKFPQMVYKRSHQQTYDHARTHADSLKTE